MAFKQCILIFALAASSQLAKATALEDLINAQKNTAQRAQLDSMTKNQREKLHIRISWIQHLSTVNLERVIDLSKTVMDKLGKIADVALNLDKVRNQAQIEFKIRELQKERDEAYSQIKTICEWFSTSETKILSKEDRAKFEKICKLGSDFNNWDKEVSDYMRPILYRQALQDFEMKQTETAAREYYDQRLRYFEYRYKDTKGQSYEPAVKKHLNLLKEVYGMALQDHIANLKASKPAGNTGPEKPKTNTGPEKPKISPAPQPGEPAQMSEDELYALFGLDPQLGKFMTGNQLKNKAQDLKKIWRKLQLQFNPAKIAFAHPKLAQEINELKEQGAVPVFNPQSVLGISEEKAARIKAQFLVEKEAHKAKKAKIDEQLKSKELEMEKYRREAEEKTKQINVFYYDVLLKRME